MEKNVMSVLRDYDFRLDYLCEFIARGGYRRVLLQLPEGLKPFSWTVAEEIERRCNTEVVVYGDPSWGACDVPFLEALRVGAGLIVHYGHYPYAYAPVERVAGVEVVYVPLDYVPSISEELVERLANELTRRGLRRPLLVSNAQHAKSLRAVASRLEKVGLSPIVPVAPGVPPGLVVGCDYRVITLTRREDYDSVVVAAGGLFHALGAALATDAPVMQLDPYRGEVKDVGPERDRWLKLRYGVISRALGARNWAIWVGSLHGQSRFDLAKRLAALVERAGGVSRVFVSRYVTSRELSSVDTEDIHAHVVTSCPRVPIDDFSLLEYPKPVLTPGEATMVLTGQLEPYRFLW